MGTSSAETRVVSAEAVCPSGQRAVSGGHAVITGDAEVAVSRSSGDGWTIIAANHGPIDGTAQAYAYCADAGKAVVASRDNWVARQLAKVRKRYQD
jgi:hypothetical protein